MYKNYGFIFGEYYIRLTRQTFHMQPVPEPVFMQKLTHQHFGFGILAPYARHVVTAGFFGVYICHNAKVSQNESRLTPSTIPSILLIDQLFSTQPVQNIISFSFGQPIAKLYGVHHVIIKLYGAGVRFFAQHSGSTCVIV